VAVNGAFLEVVQSDPILGPGCYRRSVRSAMTCAVGEWLSKGASLIGFTAGTVGSRPRAWDEVLSL
jgi:hypothetical protein